jgi:hypothetical protein
MNWFHSISTNSISRKMILWNWFNFKDPNRPKHFREGFFCVNDLTRFMDGEGRATACLVFIYSQPCSLVWNVTALTPHITPKCCKSLDCTAKPFLTTQWCQLVLLIITLILFSCASSALLTKRRIIWHPSCIDLGLGGAWASIHIYICSGYARVMVWLLQIFRFSYRSAYTTHAVC